ncbi:DUF6602 domain-containing protein [Pontixanthobacter sp.]|uniref:DUF6602 domain-containing protein n=1 Tax=Pontixanthobacter sp. TaxID=2792078 RepID=UPI003C7DF898
MDDDQNIRPGIFIFDGQAPWDELVSGMTCDTNDGQPGVWFARTSVEELKESPEIVPLKQFAPGRLQPHILMQALHGDPDDGHQPIRDIYAATFQILRGTVNRTLALNGLIAQLEELPKLDATLIEPVMRMMGTMGVLSITADGNGFRVMFSASLEESHKRRDYLATFTNELMARSRRIDLLVGHAGTVGSYREELLLGLLHQLLPRRYEATTGFIEGCPRQLDIIIWDTENYTPLFREQNFVVVPLASVRAVVEVKTTLSNGALRKGMEILWDTFRNRPTILPIFKGIFAFEEGLKGSDKVASVMRSFYGSTDGTGLIPHEHAYYWSGINAVCVPGHCLVRERYSCAAADKFPQPILTGVDDPIGDDAYSALFLGVLLSHLDIDLGAKLQNNKTFEPVLQVLEEQDHGPIYAEWSPGTALSELSATLNSAGANAYVRQVHEFRAGRRFGDQVGEGLAKDAEPAGPNGEPPQAVNESWE